MDKPSNVFWLSKRRRAMIERAVGDGSEVCENCRFWVSSMEDEGRIGMCRRFPPKFIADWEFAQSIDETCGHFTGFFPETLAYEWCGEWVPAEAR